MLKNRALFVNNKMLKGILNVLIRSIIQLDIKYES